MKPDNTKLRSPTPGALRTVAIRGLAAVVGLVAATTIANAQTFTWDANGTGTDRTDGPGAWLEPNQWWNGSTNITWSPGVDAVFGVGGTGGAVTLASPTTINSLTFNNFGGTYTLGTASNAITLNNGITLNSGTSNVTILSPVTLGGAQIWTNNSSNGAIQLLVNGTVDNGGFNLTIDGSAAPPDRTTANVRFGGILTGAGGLIKNGPGVLWFSGSNPTYGGKTTVNGGVLRAQGGISGLPTGNIVLNGGVIESYWNDTFTRGLGADSNQIQLTGGASGFSEHGSAGLIVRLNNDATTAIQWGSTHFNPSALVLQSEYANNNSKVTFQNALDLNGAQRTITVNQGSLYTGVNAEMTGVLSNSSMTPAGITKTGAGRLVLNNNSNSYNGPTIVNGGVLQIGTAFNVGNSSLPGGYTGNPSTGSNLQLNGGIVSYFFDFNRTLGTGAGQVQLAGGRSGFTQKQADRVGLTFGSASTEVVWGSTVFNPSTLVLNQASEAPAAVISFNNLLDLNGANRTIWSDSVAAAPNNNQNYAVFGAVTGRGAYFANNIRNSDVDDTAGFIKTGAGIIGFGGTNTYDGGTTVNEGGVFFNKLVSMPASGVVTINNGTALIVSVGGSGEWTAGTSGSGTIGGLLSGLGGQSGSTISYNGNVTLGLNVTGTQTYTGDIANVGSGLGLTIYSQSGSGVLRLTGTNTYSGVTRINAGVLEVSRLATGSANSSIGNPGSTAANRLLLGNGTTLRFVGDGTGNDTTNRNFTINGTADGHIATLDASGAGTETITFSNTSSPAYGVNNQTRTLILSGTNTGNNTLSANIANNGTGAVSVTKNGTGRWVLTGTSNYTGATRVNGGTLQVDGSLASGSAVTVGGSSASGSPTLGGTGTINGAVTVASAGGGVAGTLAPGGDNALGTLTVNNNVSFNAGSTFAAGLGASGTSDLLNLTGSGTLIFADGSILKLFDEGVGTGYAPSYTLATVASGSLTPGTLGTFTVGGSSTGSVFIDTTSLSGLNNGDIFMLTQSASTVTLSYTPVPEPSTVLAMGAGFLGFCGLIRRRRKTVEAVLAE